MSSTINTDTPHRLLTRIRKTRPENENKQIEYQIIAPVSLSSPQSLSLISQGPPSSRVQTATEKIQSLTLEIEKLKEEKEKVINEKSQWLIKLQEDNQKLTDLLKTVHFARDRIIRRVEEFELGDVLVDDSLQNIEENLKASDNGSQISTTEANNNTPKISITSSNNTHNLSTINEEWEAEFSSLHTSLREYLWEKALLNISDLVDRNPLVKLIPSNIVKEGINEIASELKGIIGHSFISLIKTSVITISASGVDESIKENIDVYLSKLLMSTTVRHDLIAQVTMFFTYLYVKFGIPPKLSPQEYGNNYFKNNDYKLESQSYTLYESPTSPTNANIPRYMQSKSFTTRSLSPDKFSSSRSKSPGVVNSNRLQTSPLSYNNPRIFSNNASNEPYMIEDDVRTLRISQSLSQSQNLPRYMTNKGKPVKTGFK